MGTSVERSHANTDLASRADSYAMAHSKVDGQDYFAVRDAAQEIVDNMRRRPAPFFLEAVTYRYSGHGAADGAETQATYRDDDEIEEWKRRDPLIILGETLRARGILDDARHEALDKDAVDKARQAAAFAEELTQDVYVD